MHVQAVLIQFYVHSVSAAVTVVSSQLSASSSLCGDCNQLLYFVNVLVCSLFDFWVKNQLPCHFVTDAWCWGQFYYDSSCTIPSLSTRIVSLRFQSGGHSKRLNLGLVCFVCVICIPLFRCISVFCCIWSSLVLCVFLQCFDTVGWVIWSVKTRPRYDL